MLTDHRWTRVIHRSSTPPPQDCDLRVLARDSCGLSRDTSASVTLNAQSTVNTLDNVLFQPQKHATLAAASVLTRSSSVSHWESFLYSTKQLPICTSGSSPGRWVLPCISCNRPATCFWSQATWQPYNCRYVVLPRDAVAKCFANKKVSPPPLRPLLHSLLSHCLAFRQFIFIGDSTNRGIMHYLMERVNGSIFESDKSHDIKIYNNLNFARTQFSFAYYPKFWLPTFQRPTFDKSLVQLLQRFVVHVCACLCVQSVQFAREYTCATICFLSLSVCLVMSSCDVHDTSPAYSLTHPSLVQ